jgi:hypothetical protein
MVSTAMSTGGSWPWSVQCKEALAASKRRETTIRAAECKHRQKSVSKPKGTPKKQALRSEPLLQSRDPDRKTEKQNQNPGNEEPASGVERHGI